MKPKPDMLRIRLLKYFGLNVLVFGVLLAFLSVQIIRKQVVHRAETQVRSDLNAAWGVLNSEVDKIETVLRLTADRPGVVETCRVGLWDNAEFRKQLELVRTRYGLDFLSVLSNESKVVVRSAPPYATGDYFVAETTLREALRGSIGTGITLMTADQLNREHGSLADRAYLVREDTPRARPSDKKVEARGMVALSAVPVRVHNEVVAVLYGGMLLNRNNELVARIRDTGFRNEKYKGIATGSVTIFLHDCRVATTVRRENGTVALGTLVSKEVADQVLDNGKPWLGRAFVVRDWYLTAYDPIRDLSGQIIGMLYVGILEAPFADMIRTMIFRYALISLGGILVTLLVAFLVASYVAKPLHALADVANGMRKGEKPRSVHAGNCSAETHTLIEAFNRMARELTEREDTLREVNESLVATNRSYMETLGFISHELKTPLGSIMNYTYLLGENCVGVLNDKQQNAVRNIDRNTRRITEMVRHYLNLSRIENNELRPTLTRLDLGADILTGLLETFGPALEEKNIQVVNEIEEKLMLRADYNMTLEVFENVLSNAIKYGNEGGAIWLQSDVKDEMVEFRVRNTGDGIAPDNRQTLFQKFVRVNGTQTRQHRGTGLGLFIARHIVEAHGGTITVDSQQGEWTEFRFTLPLYREVVVYEN